MAEERQGLPLAKAGGTVVSASQGGPRSGAPALSPVRFSGPALLNIENTLPGCTRSLGGRWRTHHPAVHVHRKAGFDLSRTRGCASVRAV